MSRAPVDSGRVRDPSALPPPHGDLVRVYRTLPARIVGWTMVAVAGVLAALTVVDLATGSHQGLAWPAAMIVAVAGLSWVLFLRPHVQLRTDGVVLANLVSDTRVPFAAVEEVTDRWALELHDHQGRRHSSWAVPVRREWVRRRAVDDFAEATRHRGSAGTTAQGVSDQVHRTLQRWRLDGGEARAQAHGGAEVTRGPAWSAIVVLALAVVLLVVALLS